MKNLNISVGIFFLLFTLLNAQSNQTLRFFGFWDNDIERNINFTNLNFRDNNITEIQQYAQQGVKTLYPIEHDFITSDANGSDILKTNWQENWASTISIVTPLIQAGQVIGFFLGDELVWNGLNISDLYTYSNAVRSSFPDRSILTWYNEAAGPISVGVDKFVHFHNYSIPPSLSMISVDIYHMDGLNKVFVDEIKSFYEFSVYPKMTSDQYAALIPGSFGSEVNKKCNMSCYDEMISYDAYEFYKWAQKDAKIIGMMPWNWAGCGSGCISLKDEIGTVDARLVKEQAAWLDIGSQIKNRSYKNHYSQTLETVERV